MSLIYLCGPIGGLTWEEANRWRVSVSELLLPMRTLSPLRDLEGKPLHDQVFTTDGRMTSNSKDAGKIPFVTLFNRDYLDVDICNGILVNMIGAKRKSVGSIMEVARGFKRGVPMVLAMESGNINEDVFFEQHFRHPSSPMNVRVHTLGEAVNAMRDAFGYPAYDFGD